MRGEIKARFALQGQPCQRPYRVRAMPALGYRAFQVLNYLTAYCGEHGRAPQYEKVCEHTGIGSCGEVSRIIGSLERRGLLSRTGKGSAMRITLNSANVPSPEKL